MRNGAGREEESLGEPSPGWSAALSKLGREEFELAEIEITQAAGTRKSAGSWIGQPECSGSPPSGLSFAAAFLIVGDGYGPVAVALVAFRPAAARDGQARPFEAVGTLREDVAGVRQPPD